MVIYEDDTAPGFIFAPEHSRRHTAKVLIDTDFADDIVLLSNTISQAQGLPYTVESACISVALHFNFNYKEGNNTYVQTSIHNYMYIVLARVFTMIYTKVGE